MNCAVITPDVLLRRSRRSFIRLNALAPKMEFTVVFTAKQRKRDEIRKLYGCNNRNVHKNGDETIGVRVEKYKILKSNLLFLDSTFLTW